MVLTTAGGLVLGGYMDRDISQLEEHLRNAKVQPREIKGLSRKTSETGTHTLYLLYFNRGAVKIEDLRRIKTLDGLWVNWRFYSKHPNDVAQCHLSEVCSLPRKADSGDDAAQTKPRIKCANCEGNHTNTGAEEYASGFVEAAHISDFQFENQRKTVHNYGTRLIRRWRKDRVEVVGHLQAAYDTDGKTVFESFIANQAGDKRKKLKIANLEEVDGFFGLLHLFHGLYEQLSAYYRCALILEFLLSLADTNSFAGASNGGPLLNLDHREDSINSNGLPAPVPMLAEFFKDGQLQSEHSRARPHRRDSSAQ
ncbi:pre-mRNA splicing factor prp17 [Culex quinquefasciatus]|uniref:Pre-mRNA splicing factor prp17 n=1 Tax=Culex quinquefasciatus TaxID=7176 RepID=B0X610_CULQU|nr:pre-mRNA splicing factor prp17 [Culex quinquefasciatus]|eukprot:XP_001865082.1 pre-mRNA splicing factor prp17 [Culex quinquefasciatus]